MPGKSVIEGLIDTDLLEPEGPFVGKQRLRRAGRRYNMSMQVTAVITHRRNPVFIVSIISQVTPNESSMIKQRSLTNPCSWRIYTSIYQSRAFAAYGHA